MKSSSLIIALFSVIFFTGCDENAQQPTLPTVKGEKITYYFQGGSSYRILQYDDKGKVTGLISGVSYPNEGTFENAHEFIYEGDVLKQILSKDAAIWSFEYTYGKNGRISESRVFLDEQLKEFYAFSYDIEGNLINELIWRAESENDELLPASQRKFKYDNNRNLTEIQQLTYDGTDFRLVTTIAYSDYDDKVNSEYMFMNNLHHPFVRLCKNNPRSVLVTHENGTSAKQKFLYEYNSSGLVTTRRIENEPSYIDFEYKKLK
jgi:hypothetical protein